MGDEPNIPADAAVSSAVRHSLGWLVFGNLVGFYLSMLLNHPALQLGEWTYGRWVPVHLNVQLYGWTSLPLVAWLFSIYEVNRSTARSWAPAAVWAWTTALAIGVFHWLNGVTSGKIFLDWKGSSLWALIAAQVILWHVLATSWNERHHLWNQRRKFASLAGLAALALVPLSLAFASSPAVYPPVDRTTGGPTGSSLLGSALIVINLMVILPRVVAMSRKDKTKPGIRIYLAFSWVFFAVTEAMGGTHFDWYQIAAMGVLLPWVWLLPRDWAGFSWPNGTRAWRQAMFAWWGILVVSGFLMYQPGILDQLKFTQGLVAHSHLAMAGFTTSFCAMLLVLLTGKRMGGEWTVWLWHLSVLVMIVTLALMGWREGDGPSWMLANPAWRICGLGIRAFCGLLMLTISMNWLIERRKI
jgi:cytochrome c oxidase cbb3-type subunit 1